MNTTRIILTHNLSQITCLSQAKEFPVFFIVEASVEIVNALSFIIELEISIAFHVVTKQLQRKLDALFFVLKTCFSLIAIPRYVKHLNLVWSNIRQLNILLVKNISGKSFNSVLLAIYQDAR